MPSSTPPALRPWQRLSVRLAALFAAVTVLAVGLVGGLVYERQRRELEETVGTQLLNIARTGALLVDPALHAEARRALDRSSAAYHRTQAALSAIREATVLLTPVYTLTDYDPARRRARRIVSSEADGPPGEPYPIAPEVAERDRVMAPGAKGFVHHSNYGAFAPDPNSNWLDNPAWRSTMTRELFAQYCADAKLRIIRQDIIDWGVPKLDCISLFEKPA